ncbi:MAG: hypothetical protein Q9180_004092, partial [Flavoplaca navasiana]
LPVSPPASKKSKDQNSSSCLKRKALTKAKLYPLTRPDGRRIWLLDTPGFDDTRRSDIHVLREIATIFVQLKEHIELAGIIYLHPITDIRMRGSALRNLKLLEAMSGEAAYKHLALVTTKWETFNGSDGAIAQQREVELKNEWWAPMQNAGSLTIQHHGTADSARNVVTSVLVQYFNHGRFSLRIHDEMMAQGLRLEDTAAGKELMKDIRQAQAQCQRLIDEADEQFQRALVERRDEHAGELSRQREELNARMVEVERNQEELRAHYEDMLRTQRAEYESALRVLQQHCDDADRRQSEIQEELEKNSKALEEGRQEFEEQNQRYKMRIEELKRQNRDWEAKVESSKKAQQKASNRTQRQEMANYHHKLSVDYQRAWQEYQQYRVACAGFAGVVNIGNYNYITYVSR